MPNLDAGHTRPSTFAFAVGEEQLPCLCVTQRGTPKPNSSERNLRLVKARKKVWQFGRGRPGVLFDKRAAMVCTLMFECSTHWHESTPQETRAKPRFPQYNTYTGLDFAGRGP